MWNYDWDIKFDLANQQKQIWPMTVCSLIKRKGLKKNQFIFIVRHMLKKKVNDSHVTTATKAAMSKIFHNFMMVDL